MIILYGGSFNPPTLAHYKIAQYLIKKYQPKAFIFIPVGNKYQKSHLIPFRYRYQMVKLIADKLENTVVSDYEDQLQFKGTIDTLNYFQSRYEDNEVYYVIGADNLLTITEWIEYETLLRDYHFIVLKRNHINIKQYLEKNPILKQYEQHIIIEEDLENIPISATQYRDLREDKVVIDEVNDYIYQNRLYTRGE